MLGRVVIFSAVSGRLTRGGAPVVGAPVRRSFDWAWGGETGADATTTDADGRFAFPAIERSSLSAKLAPHQPSIIQTIVFDVAEGAREGWQFQKSNYDRDGELGGRALRLDCELGEPDMRHELHYGFCRIV